MKCTCILCNECEGTGMVWYSFSGEYLWNHLCDGFGSLETCEVCEGTGLAEICENCLQAEEES